MARVNLEMNEIKFVEWVALAGLVFILSEELDRSNLNPVGHLARLQDMVVKRNEQCPAESA